LSTLFIATNLAIGYTFSTLAQGPVAGHPDGDDVLSAQYADVRVCISVPRHAEMGAGLQRMASAHAHIRIVRAIMLKGALARRFAYDTLALAGMVTTIVAVRASAARWIDRMLSARQYVDARTPERFRYRRASTIPCSSRPSVSTLAAAESNGGERNSLQGKLCHN
jgi:hypothetical protein